MGGRLLWPCGGTEQGSSLMLPLLMPLLLALSVCFSLPVLATGKGGFGKDLQEPRGVDCCWLRLHGCSVHLSPLMMVPAPPKHGLLHVTGRVFLGATHTLPLMLLLLSAPPAPVPPHALLPGRRAACVMALRSCRKRPTSASMAKRKPSAEARIGTESSDPVAAAAARTVPVVLRSRLGGADLKPLWLFKSPVSLATPDVGATPSQRSAAPHPLKLLLLLCSRAGLDLGLFRPPLLCTERCSAKMAEQTSFRS